MGNNEYPLNWRGVMRDVGVYERQTPIDGKRGSFVVVVRDRSSNLLPFFVQPSSTPNAPYSIVSVNEESVLTYVSGLEEERMCWRRVSGMRFAMVLTMVESDNE